MLTRCFEKDMPIVSGRHRHCQRNAHQMQKITFQVVFNLKIEFFRKHFFKIEKTAKTTQKRPFRTFFLPHKTK